MSETFKSSPSYLSEDEIEEIHTAFVLIDSDGSGNLSMDKLQKAILRITKTSEIIRVNISSLYGQMDLDHDGSVTWPDFLNFMSFWLMQFNVIRPKIRTDLAMTSHERKMLHKAISGILANGYTNAEFSQYHVDSLEARTETWDYLGESKIYTIEEQKDYLSKVMIKIQESEFFRILQQIQQPDMVVVYSGLEELKELLRVLCYFSTSYDRQGVSDYLLNLFSKLVSSNVLSLIIKFLSYDKYKQIQWQALNILTLMIPGPRLPNFPNESKKCVEIFKALLISSACLNTILQLCNSECIEVSGQALLAIGFITRYDSSIRNSLYSQGAISVLLGILKKGHNKLIDVSSLVRAAWALSIFTGATMDQDKALPPNMSNAELQEIAETVLGLFASQDESNLLANSLISLSYVLPYIIIKDFTHWILERLIQLISHDDLIVRKAVLQTIRNIICRNSEQCHILIQFGLFIRINDILTGSENSLVLDGCNILKLLIEKGFIWGIISLPNLSLKLQALIKTNKETRRESLRILKLMLQNETKLIIEDLVRTGLIEILFSSLALFRDSNSSIASQYGDSPVLYHFGYLNDCLLVLQKFLLSGWINGDFKQTNAFLPHFQLDQAKGLVEVIRVLVEECKKGKDLYQITYASVNVRHRQVGSSIVSLVDKFIYAHQEINNGESLMIVELLNKASIYFKNMLSTGMEFNSRIDDFSLLSSVQRFIIKTIEPNKYPNGKNYAFYMNKNEDFEYMSVKNTINNLYKEYKKIEYNDSKNDMILIDNQNTLNYSMIDATQFTYQEQMKSMQLLGKPIPNVLVIPLVEIKFIVSDMPAPHNLSNFAANYEELTHQFLNQKTPLLRELSSNYEIPVSELEVFHLEYSRFTQNRRADGRLNKFEFTSMMEYRGISNKAFIGQLFDGLDEFHSGFVEFRNYVAGISTLRSSSIDRKLFLVFNAFCKREYGYMSRHDLYELLIANGNANVGSNLQDLVNYVFDVYDKDRDGKINFNDFKSVWEAKMFVLDSLWLNFHMNFQKNMTQCAQCGMQTPIKEGLSIPKCSLCIGKSFYV